MNAGARELQVLVVEEDALVRFAIVEALAAEGFEVTEATNSIEALAAMSKTEGIRAVITDIDMPGSVNGLGLVRTLKDERPYLHIIIISGLPLPNDYRLPQEVTYLRKPFSFARLLDLLRERFPP